MQSVCVHVLHAGAVHVPNCGLPILPPDVDGAVARQLQAGGRTKTSPSRGTRDLGGFLCTVHLAIHWVARQRSQILHPWLPLLGQSDRPGLWAVLPAPVAGRGGHWPGLFRGDYLPCLLLPCLGAERRDKRKWGGGNAGGPSHRGARCSGKKTLIFGWVGIAKDSSAGHWSDRGDCAAL